VAVALAVMVIEALAFTAYAVRYGQMMSPGALQGERDALTGGPARSVEARHLVDRLEFRDVRTPEQIGAEVLHPYLGYVFTPEQSDQARASYGVGISRWGFLDDKGPIHAAAPNRVVVGVFGGSVAWYLSSESAEALVRGLRASPSYRDKEIVIVRAALFGYKQPQQLLALTYLLSMGAHFDVVINLDGFNEVVLPVTENVSKKVFPFFPRTWFLRAADSESARRVADRITDLRVERRNTAGWASMPLARYSPTVNLAWRMRDRALSNRIDGEQAAWLQSQSSDGNYAGTGPFEAYAGDERLYADLADKWKQASLQMHRLATANGARYFHFLQPNQYVEGSKVMSPEERAIAIDEGFMFAAPARAGYPRLISAGKELQQAGVQYHDLTTLFATVSERVYRDNCCHLERNGGEMMALAIAAAVVRGA
jgi:hypothetical protein